MSKNTGTALCETCGGTGRQLLMNSWFKRDGLRRERCGICDGSGRSAYGHSDREFVVLQAKRRLETTA